jgi:hypothetical protein
MTDELIRIDTRTQVAQAFGSGSTKGHAVVNA